MWSESGGGTSPVPTTQQIIVTNKPRDANPPAIASFIVSLLSALTIFAPVLSIIGFILALIAISLGITGLNKCKKQEKGNHGLAVTGITIGIIALIIHTIITLYLIIIIISEL